MNTKLLLPLIVYLAAATAGCSLTPNRQAPEEAAPSGTPAPLRTGTRSLQERIYTQHRQWKGTRYQLGGLGPQGIDCSGLVYITYRDQLGVELPRTTRDQARAGEAVPRSELRAGDLVFFKTGYKVRHVGIYIEDNKVFHASSSKGVTISKLNGYYWGDKYWQARRVDLHTGRGPVGK
ncbi:C40 family peptidase [Microbulbifer halophilus]|uniref:C40 family peptidase n=1 Tax=Microbulbifer halophilus TaxID=453963 RepID=A0ABW5EFS8_9GAMM|nr:NlpC/P60 family protein [Microbulbifer halophilus]MCW8128613.1 NlpC/P60 family protein [Microbulbifer halophilus]